MFIVFGKNSVCVPGSILITLIFSVPQGSMTIVDPMGFTSGIFFLVKRDVSGCSLLQSCSSFVTKLVCLERPALTELGNWFSLCKMIEVGLSDCVSNHVA